MGHIPYGYSIENGIAVIDEVATKRVRAFFEAYLAGLSLKDAGNLSGVNRCHSSLGKMLEDIKYLGDGFYPLIIDKDLFELAKVERLHRLAVRGRVGKPKPLKTAQRIPKVRFYAQEITQAYDDPFRQAEYAYNLIQCEEITDDK